ncbi:MAG: PQQ-like beta-propeller repeat protein [Planctomycetes bacterium]|nr:PQQ-like beta-propeller repeat protein [Planctomycetota bacterium]
MHSFTGSALFVGIAGLVGLSVQSLHAEDAPQFRGIGGLGISKETGLPTTWSDKENIRWKAALPGRGLSAPVIADGRVYVTANSTHNQKRLHVLCFDEKTGKQLWERQFWATGSTFCHPKTCMAAPTPVTDGERVVALFATGDLVSLDKDGNLEWVRSLVGDYPTVGNNVGMAASPILWKDLVILFLENVGDSFVAGIDKRTGENKWRVERPKGINWCSPLMIENNGQPEIVLQSNEDLTAYDPVNGNKKWALTGKKFQPIPSPTFGDGLVFSPGFKFFAVQPGSGKEDPQILWESNKLPTGYGSPIYHDRKIYALSYRGIINCADGATGKPIWNLRIEGTYAASPLLADGKIYSVNEDGITQVVTAGAEGKLLASNPIGDKILATPVASNGAIYLRSDGFLYCIAQKK